MLFFFGSEGLFLVGCKLDGNADGAYATHIPKDGRGVSDAYATVCDRGAGRQDLIAVCVVALS